MSDIISQEELDALLEAFPREEPGKPSTGSEAAYAEGSSSLRVQRPSETGRGRLENVLDIFIAEATRQLSHLLRTNTKLSPATVRHMSYHEFASQLPNPSTVAVVGMPPVRERFIVEIEPPLAFPVVDTLLGGKGSPYRKLRNLTDLEKRILARFVRTILQALGAAANLPEGLTPEVETVQDATTFTPCFDDHEPVTSAHFTLDIGAATGTMRLCLPQAAIELLCDPAATLVSIRSASDPAREVHFVRNVIGDLKVPMAAYLGKATVTLNDVISMQQGDVIVLDRRTQEGLTLVLHVGGRPKFSASLGMVGNRRAARIVGLLER